MKAYSQPPKHPDIQCDLHNRFNQSGTKVSFDSFDEENRSIYEFEFDKNTIQEDENVNKMLSNPFIVAVLVLFCTALWGTEAVRVE